MKAIIAVLLMAIATSAYSQQKDTVPGVISYQKLSVKIVSPGYVVFAHNQHYYDILSMDNGSTSTVGVIFDGSVINKIPNLYIVFLDSKKSIVPNSAVRLFVTTQEK